MEDILIALLGFVLGCGSAIWATHWYVTRPRPLREDQTSALELYQKMKESKK